MTINQPTKVCTRTDDIDHAATHNIIRNLCHTHNATQRGAEKIMGHARKSGLCTVGRCIRFRKPRTRTTLRCPTLEELVGMLLNEFEERTEQSIQKNAENREKNYAWRGKYKQKDC